MVWLFPFYCAPAGCGTLRTHRTIWCFITVFCLIVGGCLIATTIPIDGLCPRSVCGDDDMGDLTFLIFFIVAESIFGLVVLGFCIGGIVNLIWCLTEDNQEPVTEETPPEFLCPGTLVGGEEDHYCSKLMRYCLFIGIPVCAISAPFVILIASNKAYISGSAITVTGLGIGVFFLISAFIAFLYKLCYSNDYQRIQSMEEDEKIGINKV